MGDRLATFDDERAFFAYWAPAFEAIMGAPVVVHDRGPDDIRLTFPRVFDQIDLIGNTGFFAHRPSMVRYVRELGYDWEEDGRILTCPSPATLNARFDAMVGPDVGWRLGFVVEESGTMAMGPFLRRYLDGFLPIHAGTASFYQTTASAAHARGLYGFHFCSVAHDLSVHALNYHMVPRWAIDRIRAAVSDAMPDRFAAWAAPGATAPLTIGYMLDNDLNRFCYSLWCRSDSPAQFATLFERHFDLLQTAIDLRIDETLRGVGDVASGDTNDMAPLTPTRFDLP